MNARDSMLSVFLMVSLQPSASNCKMARSSVAMSLKRVTTSAGDGDLEAPIMQGVPSFQYRESCAALGESTLIIIITRSGSLEVLHSFALNNNNNNNNFLKFNGGVCRPDHGEEPVGAHSSRRWCCCSATPIGQPRPRRAHLARLESARAFACSTLRLI